MFVLKLNPTFRLRLMLIAAAGLLVLNLWPSSFTVVAAVDRHPGVMALSVPALQDTVATAERPMLEPARRDPFLAESTVLAPVVKPPPAPPVLVTAPPTMPLPSAPPMNMQYVGKVVQADGKQTVYVAFGETHVPVEQGTILSNGYRVEKITDSFIEFNFLALNTLARLAIPPAPRYEIR